MTKAENLLELVKVSTRTGYPLPQVLTPKNPSVFDDGSVLRLVGGQWVAERGQNPEDSHE